MELPEWTARNFALSRSTSCAILLAILSSTVAVRFSLVTDLSHSGFCSAAFFACEMRSIYDAFEAFDSYIVSLQQLTIADLALAVQVEFFPLFLLGSLLGVFLFLRCVPLLDELVLPADLVSYLVDPVLDDGQRLSHLVVFHVLFVIELVGELQQLVDLFLLRVFLHLFRYSPRGFFTFRFFLLFLA